MLDHDATQVFSIESLPTTDTSLDYSPVGLLYPEELTPAVEVPVEIQDSTY